MGLYHSIDGLTSRYILGIMLQLMAGIERLSDKDLPHELRFRDFRTAMPYYAFGLPTREELNAHLARVDQFERDLAASLLQVRPLEAQQTVEIFEMHRLIADNSLENIKEQGLHEELQPRANAE